MYTDFYFRFGKGRYFISLNYVHDCTGAKDPRIKTILYLEKNDDFQEFHWTMHVFEEIQIIFVEYQQIIN